MPDFNKLPYSLRSQGDKSTNFLQDEKNMAEEERNRAKVELEKHEEELARAQGEHDAMRAKLVALERKIIVGGENLLEKAEEQVRYSGDPVTGHVW